jgi:hypothetical protein
MPIPIVIGHQAADELDQWLKRVMNGHFRFTEGPHGDAWMEALRALAREKYPDAPPVKKGFSRKYAVEAVVHGVDPERIKAAFLLIFS